MPNDLQFVIKSIYDKTGIRLAIEDVQKLHEQGKLPADVFNRLGQQAEKAGELGWRASNRIRTGFLETAGIGGPVTQTSERLEYLGYISDRTGLSISELFEKFGPSLVAAASVGILAKELSVLADMGARAFGDQGLGSRGWLENVIAGAGLIDTLNGKVEKTADIAERFTARAERVSRVESRAAEDAGGAPSASTRIKREQEDSDRHAKEERDELLKQRAELETRRAAVSKLTGTPLEEEYRGVMGKKPSELLYEGTAQRRIEAELKRQIAEIDKKLPAVEGRAEARSRGLTARAATVGAQESQFANQETAREAQLQPLRNAVDLAPTYQARIAAQKKLHLAEIAAEQAHQNDIAAQFGKGLLSIDETNKQIDESERRSVAARSAIEKEGFEAQRTAERDAITKAESDRENKLAGLRANVADAKTYEARIAAQKELNQAELQAEKDHQADIAAELEKGLITAKEADKQRGESQARYQQIRAAGVHNDFENERTQTIASLEATSHDERKSYSERVSAVRQLAEQRKKTEGPGEREIEDERAYEQIKSLGTRRNLSHEFFENSDAFERAGLETGGAAGNGATAGWMAMHETMKKTLEATLRLEDPTQALNHEVY